MILNIRGSSCSGKSALVRQLIKDYPSSEVWERTGWNKTRAKHVGHLLPGGLLIVGPYVGKPGDGLTALQPGRTELVTLWMERNAVRFPFILAESTAAALSIGRYHDLRVRLDSQLGVQNSITFAYVDTPLEVCQQRMATAGREDPESVATQWHRVEQVRTRLTDLEETCLTLDWEDSYAQLITLLQTIGGWDPFSTPPIIHPKVKTRYTLQDVWTELQTIGYPDSDPDRIKRLKAEIDKHREKFPVM